jgi:hypothetical protein
MESLFNEGKIYRYKGSLTTPPCTENVVWSVVPTIMPIAQETLFRFTNLTGLNARPVQTRGVSVSQLKSSNANLNQTNNARLNQTNNANLNQVNNANLNQANDANLNQVNNANLNQGNNANLNQGNNLDGNQLMNALQSVMNIVRGNSV